MHKYQVKCQTNGSKGTIAHTIVVRAPSQESSKDLVRELIAANDDDDAFGMPYNFEVTEMEHPVWIEWTRVPVDGGEPEGEINYVPIDNGGLSGPGKGNRDQARYGSAPWRSLRY